MKQDKFHQAFTLVELMLVVMIIGVLAAMVVPRLTGRSEIARESVARGDIGLALATALKLYKMDNGSSPTTEEGLPALLIAPASARNWKGPYWNSKLVDPWGRDYIYRSPGVHCPGQYDLMSLAGDGIESRDDIVNWKDDGC